LETEEERFEICCDTGKGKRRKKNEKEEKTKE
jgi:hypothetical protein